MGLSTKNKKNIKTGGVPTYKKHVDNVGKKNMKFCQKCGKEIMDEAVVCPGCGCAQESPVKNTEDAGGFGWATLGFCIPVAGLVLYLVWKDTMPLRAKSLGKSALVRGIISIILLIVYVYFIYAFIVGFVLNAF